MNSPSETPSELYCLIRKAWVAALPEERIRQQFIKYMIEERGFPASLIAVEQPLRLLPHLEVADRRRVPDRRADILCFAGGKTGVLEPLLLIECKAVKLTERMVNQVLGYNHYVGSRFVCLVNDEQIRTGWYDAQAGRYFFIDFLPAYHELLSCPCPKGTTGT